MFIRTQLQLTQEQIEALQKLASERHVSVPALIRQRVDGHIQHPKVINRKEQRQ